MKHALTVAATLASTIGSQAAETATVCSNVAPEYSFIALHAFISDDGSDLNNVFELTRKDDGELLGDLITYNCATSARQNCTYSIENEEVSGVATLKIDRDLGVISRHIVGREGDGPLQAVTQTIVVNCALSVIRDFGTDGCLN